VKKLTKGDFKTVKIGASTYLSFKGKHCEICIESGFGCVDISVYDLKQDILEPKITINEPAVDALQLVVLFKRIDIVVNEFYQKYELKEVSKK